ncbi:hypothetical protein JTE90_006004 [Oedothorax gibbosus]|uniref:Uncharacterized protein n=1 Tax=Oedothorax gibbosus TaxID=931172 RepID=A0AAV6TIZ5_9ARAC|nr:hypothetical protein JTE90_006004 [Oedothorax gibbosus]
MPETQMSNDKLKTVTATPFPKQENKEESLLNRQHENNDFHSKNFTNKKHTNQNRKKEETPRERFNQMQTQLPRNNQVKEHFTSDTRETNVKKRQRVKARPETGEIRYQSKVRGSTRSSIDAPTDKFSRGKQAQGSDLYRNPEETIDKSSERNQYQVNGRRRNPEESMDIHSENPGRKHSQAYSRYPEKSFDIPSDKLPRRRQPQNYDRYRNSEGFYWHSEFSRFRKFQ